MNLNVINYFVEIVTEILAVIWEVYYVVTFELGGTIYALAFAAVIFVASLGFAGFFFFAYRKRDIPAFLMVLVVLAIGFIALLFIIRIGIPMQTVYYQQQEYLLQNTFFR